MSWKYFFVIFGYTQAVGMSIVLILTFFSAYLNDYKTVVLVNQYGEAHIELIFIIIISVFIFGGCFFMLRDLEYEKNRDE